MRKRSMRMLTIVVLIMTMVIATACSNNGGNSENKEPDSNRETNTPQNTQINTSEHTEAMEPGPYGKYDPPITITTVRSETPGVERLPDQTVEDNVWTREYLSELGIELKYDWIVNSQQYPNKIMVTVVSGDLPDFFEVNMQTFQTLAQADQLADLTEVFEEYASEHTKRNFTEFGRKNGTVNGKLVGFPRDGGVSDDANMLYIRQDWLDNLGLEPPKTMDDVMKVAIAFAKNDPDQNGLDDTYGLAISKDLFDGFASIAGFLNGFGAYGYNPANGSGTNLIFMKDESGKAVWADIQPEVKTALGKLNELFEAGAIHPEFSVQDGARIGDLLTSGKVGMIYGAFWVPTWPIHNMKSNDPSVDWRVYEAPSVDGSPSIVQSTAMPTKFAVVSKKSKHPEALIKLINYTTDKLDPITDAEKYHTIFKNGKNYQLHTLAPIYFGVPDKNQNSHYTVVEALEKNDPSGLDEELTLYYEQVKKYEAGDYSQFAGYTLWAPGGVFATLGKYKQNNRILTTAYTGAPTPTMLARGPSLRDLEVKTFTDIIMGSKPLDAFDEFVEQWYQQGGQDILDEVNETGQVQ